PRAASSRSLDPLRCQVVRVIRQVLRAAVGDEHQVLQPAAAEPRAVKARLDCDHVARDELLAGSEAEAGLLVELEADAVPEAVDGARRWTRRPRSRAR